MAESSFGGNFGSAGSRNTGRSFATFGDKSALKGLMTSEVKKGIAERQARRQVAEAAVNSVGTLAPQSSIGRNAPTPTTGRGGQRYEPGRR